MSATAFISNDQLAKLVTDLSAAGTSITAPTKNAAGEATYAHIHTLSEAAFNDGLPTLSLKGFFLPPSEELFSWRQHGTDVEITPAPSTFPAQLILGARPCDVAALEVVDSVMNWDYKDDLWNGRRSATTILTMACPGHDDSCFCSAVGIGPDSARGADGLLVPVSGGYVAELTTEKGEAFLAEHKQYFSETAAEAAVAAEAMRNTARARVESNLAIDTGRVSRWIDTHFNDEYWPSLGPRCNGCGVCSSVCPTCHCFDIVDEPAGIGAGTRRRNWDTCQAGKFTLHASGHNPRGDQNARYRQRINHKFFIYPSKFGDVLCTGCGRCIRACPAGQDLVEILQHIDGLAAAEEADGGEPVAAGTKETSA
ncbi:MAG: 4Fe-4S dicluster domain-containing protein [Thermoleophilia bacterium]